MQLSIVLHRSLVNKIIAVNFYIWAIKTTEDKSLCFFFFLINFMYGDENLHFFLSIARRATNREEYLFITDKSNKQIMSKSTYQVWWVY